MKVDIGDVKIFFDVEGTKLVPDGPHMREKPTLILLHGGPGFDHSHLKPALSPLADVAQLVYIDHLRKETSWLLYFVPAARRGGT